MPCIAVAGSSGRMGRMLIEAICRSDDSQLSGALDMASSPAIGTDPAAALGLRSGANLTIAPGTRVKGFKIEGQAQMRQVTATTLVADAQISAAMGLSVSPACSV